MRKDSGPVYINAPIENGKYDFIGVESYAKRIAKALEKGAKMIAVTSSFGTGKSSLAKLIEENCKKSKRKTITISLWPELCSYQKKSKKLDTGEETDDEKLNLHKYLICKMSESINKKISRYIKEKINHKSGTIKIATPNIVSEISLFFVLAVYIIILIIEKISPDCVIFTFDIETIKSISLLVLFGIVFFVAIRSEIIFSSKESENNRDISSFEMFNLYREYIASTEQKYLIVIEDLDRTEDKNLVLDFIKELRKYYCENNNNNISFLVNIKDETEINDKTNEELLYPKLFDFILDYPKVNILDYEFILNSLLEEQKQYIINLFDLKNNGDYHIPGVEWIIEGNNINIRLIKDRLNKAFGLYESIEEKFGEKGNKPDFKKCASAIYIKTEFETEFKQTDDDVFGKLIDAKLKGNLEDELKALLNGRDREYVDKIQSLIESELINFDYHEYYYNYPKNADVYSYYEKNVYNAIINGENNENLDSDIEKCIDKESKVFKKAFEKLEKLGLKNNKLVIEKEALYIKALKYYSEGVFLYVKNLKWEINETNGYSIVNEIVNILSRDKERKIYNDYIASRFMDIIEQKNMNNITLLLREQLCANFPNEIKWYKKLFFGNYPTISKIEASHLNFYDALELTNIESSTFNKELVLDLLDLVDRNNAEGELLEKFYNFIIKIRQTRNDVLDPGCYIKFMYKFNVLIPEFERNILTINKSATRELYEIYLKTINSVKINQITEDTIENIDRINLYKGCREDIKEKMYNQNLYYYVLLCIENNYEFDLSDNNIRKCIKEKFSNNIIENKETIYKLREYLLNRESKEIINKYKFLFIENCPIIKYEEISIMNKKYGFDEIAKFINIAQIDSENIKYIISVLNAKERKKDEIYEAFMLIFKLPQNVVRGVIDMIDFERSINIGKLSKENRKEIIYELVNVYGVNNITKFIDLSKKMKWLIEETDLLVSENNMFNNNSQLQIEYIDLLNNVRTKSITKLTLQNITKIKLTNYIVNSHIEEMLKKEGYIRQYLISLMNKDDWYREDIFSDEDILFESINIFLECVEKDKIYQNIANSIEYLQLVKEKRQYKIINNSKLIVFSKINQDIDLLEYISKQDTSLVEKYFESIHGFDDTYSAAKALETIIRNPILLKNDNIYNNIYNKLIDPNLKRKYTKNRTK